MTIEYEILTRVKFKHGFFFSNKLECFTVLPDRNTEQLLLKSGIIFKSFNNGFNLFYCAFSNQEKMERLAILDNDTLRFEISLNDPYFFNYTNGEFKNWSQSVYYFNNGTSAAKATTSRNLHNDAFVSDVDAIDVSLFKKQFLRKPFGIIDIRLAADLKTDYELNFKEKQTYWRYIIVSKHLKDLPDLAVIGDVKFKQSKIVLPDDSEAISFVSDMPISLKQVPARYFKLVEKYDSKAKTFSIVKELPVPDITRISSTVQLSDNRFYSEIFIH